MNVLVICKEVLWNVRKSIQILFNWQQVTWKWFCAPSCFLILWRMMMLTGFITSTGNQIWDPGTCANRGTHPSPLCSGHLLSLGWPDCGLVFWAGSSEGCSGSCILIWAQNRAEVAWNSGWGFRKSGGAHSSSTWLNASPFLSFFLTYL